MLSTSFASGHGGSGSLSVDLGVALQGIQANLATVLVKFYYLGSVLTSFVFGFEFGQGGVYGFAVFECDLKAESQRVCKWK